MSILFLLAFAIAPGVCIAIYIYLKDKHEREPLGLLVKSFFYGCLSVVVTLVISVPLSLVLPEEKTYSGEAVHAFLIVALVEEFSKFLFVRGILFKNPNFNEPFDGIVYSVMVGMGFATLENIMYVADGGWGVAIFRMFTAVPAHACFAILMGYYLGLAKFMHKKSHYAWYGLLIATLFHGAYDYFLFIGEVTGVWIGVQVGALVSLVIAIFLSKKAIKIHQESSPFQFGVETSSPHLTENPIVPESTSTKTDEGRNEAGYLK